MRIQLTRKLGQNPIGTILERTTPEVEVLVRGGHGIALGDLDAQVQYTDAEDTDPAEEQDPKPNENTETREQRVAELMAMKGDELKALAGQAGVAAYGSKQDIADRIATAENNDTTGDDDPGIDGPQA